MRIREKRYDIFPCFKSTAELPVQGKTWFSRFLSITYYDFITKKPVKIIIGIFYLALITSGIVGLTQLNLGFDPRVAVTQHGNIDKVII